MNAREKEIFLRGLNVGIRIAEEFETGLPTEKKERNVTERVRKTKGKKVPWSTEEDQVIRENPDLPGKELAKLFSNRKYSAVITRKSHLGVKSTKNKDNYKGLASLGQKLDQ